MIEGGNNKKQKPAYGADVLRLWVSSVDYTGDVCVGDKVIKQVRSEGGLWRGTPGGGLRPTKMTTVLRVGDWRLYQLESGVYAQTRLPMAGQYTVYKLRQAQGHG